MQRLSVPPYPLRTVDSIPNKEGFEFIGVDKDYVRFECVVAKDEMTGLHRVEGMPFNKMEYWLPK